MDLNPHAMLWSTEKGPFEPAEYCLSTESKPRTNVLLLLNTWLDSKEDLGERWDWQTLNYWLSRLRPLWKKEVDPHDESNSDSDDSDDGKAPPHQSTNEDRSKQTIVVICNRCGDDNGEYSERLSNVKCVANLILIQELNSLGRPRYSNSKKGRDLQTLSA